MSQVLNLDIVDILNAKMDKTEKKYPLEKSKGVSTKYDKLQNYLLQLFNEMNSKCIGY